MFVTTSIESLLFASGKPVALSALAGALGISEEEARGAVDDVRRRFNAETSGIHLVEHEGKLQFATNPSQAAVVATFLRQETSGELTRPSLETLTIIAYRGPITKPEIEQIRGVNCTLILRNLLVRGLVEETDDSQRLQPVYTVTMDFVRHLGIHSIEELPDYAELHVHERLGDLAQGVQDPV